MESVGISAGASTPDYLIDGVKNRINDITNACKTLNITKPLFVTDKGLAETDIVKKTLSLFRTH